MTRTLARWTGMLMLVASALLAGCATGYTVDTAVQSFSTVGALRQPPTYRFEWLPSQDPAERARLAALAEPALAQAGLVHEEPSAQYSVQIDPSLQAELSPWADPWYAGWGPGLGWGLGVGLGNRHGVGLGLGWGGPVFPRAEPPWYHRELQVLVRSLDSHQVVFQSRAVNDGPWMDNGAVFAAMMQAALQGFPNPPAGLRRVDVRIGPPR